MRLVFLICFLALFFGANGQPVVNRASQANTVQDARLSALYNFFLPKYADTAAANLNIGIDSLGAKIFTYDIYGEWTRTKNQNGTKYWSLTSGGGNAPGGGGNWIVSGTGQTVLNSLTGAGIGTANAYPMWFITNGQIRIQLPASGLTLSNDTTSNKVFTFNPSTKDWGYANWVGGGSGGSVSANNGLVVNSGGVVGLDSNGVNPLSRNMRIDLNGNTGSFSNGNIGIGTTSPSFKLEIAGTASTSDRKIGINGVTMMYLPDQSLSAFTNSMFFGGSNGASLSHTGGTEAYNVLGVGMGALDKNTTGYFNTAVGSLALGENTTGFYNTAIGTLALWKNTTGTQNTAVGMNALQQNITGNFNVAVGSSVLIANTTGQTNTAVGDNAMLANTTGLQNTVGGYRGMQNNNGNFNSGWGYRWGESMNTANGNSGIGNTALGLTTTGSFNYAGGFFAGYRNTTGSYNTYLGSNAGESINQVSNLQSSVAIGAGSYTTASYQLSLSDSINRFTAVGLSKGVANYVLTDSLGNGQYWVARPNAALSLGLQDVITNDPVLTASNTISLGSNSFIFSGNPTSSSIEAVVGEYSFEASGGGRSSVFSMINDSISLKPGLGLLNIDTLNSSANATDSMMVWNKSNGSVGIRAIPSGGITSLNGLTGTTQTFAVSGQGLSISSSGTTHTFTSSEYSTLTKSSDQTTSSASLVDCTDLGFSADANSLYEWEGMIIFTADASTTGIALNMNGPSVTYTATCFQIAVGGTGQTIGNSTAFSPTAYYNSTSSNGTAISMVLLHGIARTTASGTIQFKFMPEAGSGGSLTVKQYSILKWRKIP